MLTILGNLFVMMLIWGLINFAMHMFKIRKVVREHKDNPNLKGVKIVNGQVHIIEEDNNILEAEIKEEIKDLETDPVCGTEIEKANAYHVIINDASHYFCSWDCREKFLEPTGEEHL